MGLLQNTQTNKLLKMKFSKIISKRNLLLAFKRLTTASNVQYKKYYRDLYYMYEIAINQNILDLHNRLKHGSFQPEKPTKIYLPKPSGLQRPITLMCIEDQIVYQAVANILSEKIRIKRMPLENKYIFSHILNRSGDKNFFFEHWRKCYERFCYRVQRAFESGKQWVAYFDLAAYYDTISHELLLDSIFPRGGSTDIVDSVKEWLMCWSSEKPGKAIRHGIPQGPIASDFLAECFFLSIDLELSKQKSYMRYGDDIRLFSKSEIGVQKLALKLETQCREKGLIPQTNKFKIAKEVAHKKIMKILPSPLQIHEDTYPKKTRIPSEKAFKELKKVIEGRPQRIIDKTIAKYIIYRANPSQKLLKLITKLISRHPEHIDAFLEYLSRHPRSKKITSVCKTLLRKTPYEYVQGCLWEFLATRLNSAEMHYMNNYAIETARDRTLSFSSRIGAVRFLIEHEKISGRKYANFIMFQDPPLLQSLLVPHLPERCFEDKSLIRKLLCRSLPEPGLMLAFSFAEQGLSHSDFGVRTNELPRQVQNVLKALNIIVQNAIPLDPVGESLSGSFKIKKWHNWKKLLIHEYAHAATILARSRSNFHSRPSHWLGYIDSFNEIVTRSLIFMLDKHKKLGSMPTANSKELINYGALIAKNTPFHKNYHEIAENFRIVHMRRNRLPQSHPYAKKTKIRTSELKKKDRNKFVSHLNTAYSEIILHFNWI